MFVRPSDTNLHKRCIKILFWKVRMNSIFRIGGGSFRIPNLVSGITTKFNSEFDYSQVPQISQITEILVFMYLYSPYLHSYHHYFPLAYLHKAAPVLWILYLFKVYQAQNIFVEFVTNNCYYNVASKNIFSLCVQTNPRSFIIS